MRRTIGMAILAAAVGSVPALAQPAGDGPREGRRAPRGKEISEFLGLTQEQQGRWRALLAEHREAMKPLFEEGQEVRARVREVMEKDASDEEVGAAVKAAKAHREKVRAAFEDLDARLRALLDDEQKTKYEAFKAARRTGRGEGRHWHGPRQGRPDREAPPEAPPTES